ncbi:POT family-domain-containing protein [Clohesyomyces aquaticus]|uniref:POT family-domain-containing protein n=1 Tax=Clohesyomyces aquaticus TaxID=1231657 RepID=A0A1Y1XYD7_9PLEO|nr:POT family-domain-containing protein [Clohesyomyces aquaticus]
MESPITEQKEEDTSTSSPSGSQCITLDEYQGLRRVVDRIPNRVWVVAIVAFFERFAFWGVTAPWQNYMQNVKTAEAGTAPGFLGLGQAIATRIYCGFFTFYYITPLFFAVISDTRLGRLKTLCISVIVYVLGCILLFVSAMDPPPHGKWGLPGLLGAMGLIGLGGGGFKAIISPFIADQYTETQPKLKTIKSGERVVTDRALTVQYIYNLLFWVGNVGSLSWFATTALELHVSFWAAYLLPFFGISISMIVLLLGSKWYVKAPQNGNVLPKVANILIHAARDRFKMAHARPEYILEKCGKNVDWTSKLCGEVCLGLKACRVFIAFVVFYVCFDQMQNNLISQAGQMQFSGPPNDAVPAINQVACVVLGPVIQHGLYPFLIRRRIRFRSIARITVGFLFVALAMLYATIVQQVIYTAPPCYSHPNACPKVKHTYRLSVPNHVNVWIQGPVYVFVATGEIFAYVTALEYANDNSPTDMKAIVQAISLLIAGFGSLLAMAITPIARDPYLVIMYACLASAMTLATILFWWKFREYDKDDAETSHDSTNKEPDLEKAGSLEEQRHTEVLGMTTAPPDRRGDETTSIQRAIERGNETYNEGVATSLQHRVHGGTNSSETPEWNRNSKDSGRAVVDTDVSTPPTLPGPSSDETARSIHESPKTQALGFEAVIVEGGGTSSKRAIIRDGAASP